jgi:DNA-binding transcriptional LysR family regulator
VPSFSISSELSGHRVIWSNYNILLFSIIWHYHAMNFQQIETVIWVARLRSFSGAATKMNTTQPAVSTRVRELESELGVTLFARGQRGVRLTPKGREALAYAEQIMASLGDLRRKVSAKYPASGRVGLGVAEVIAQTWLPELLATLNRDHPELTIDPTVDMTLPLLRGLQQGDFDVLLIGGHGITTEYPVLELGYVEYAWMAKPGTEDPMKRLTPRDLQSRRILTWTKEAAIHKSIDDWFIQNGAYPANKILCNTTMSMVSLTAAGLGISLLPLELVTHELREGTLSIIPTEPRYQPVRYQAIYVPTLWPGFGRVIAETAQRMSKFVGHD